MRKAKQNQNITTDLTNHDRAGLLVRWRELYGTEPPHKASRKFLIQAVVYQMQEQAAGGLKPATRRFLEQVARGGDKEKQGAAPVSIKPGTRLLREWHGVTYEVTILEVGVQFQGRQYRSLSEVAHVITGVKWSGPLFFGLKKKLEKKKEEK